MGVKISADTSARLVRMMEAHNADPDSVVAPFWWHGHMLAEMERLAECGAPVFSADGISGNLRGMARSDGHRYLTECIAAGVVAVAPAAWDYEDLWVTLS